jgi:PAS domain S-box-containing protein
MTLMTEATAILRHGDPEHFEAVAEHVPTMLFRTDGRGELTFANGRWTGFTGRAAEEEQGEGWLEDVHPDDLGRVRAAFALAIETRGPFSAVFRLRRHDGSFRRVLCQGGAIGGPDGAFGGHVCSCVDVEGVEGAQPAGRKEVVDEINHRVKNALFSVQALARQTIWGTRELERAYERFAERLVALARAHDLLMDEDWRGVSIHELVRQVAKPYGREGAEFALRGEAVQVAPQLSLSLALCLQELFANAGKVGALASDGGKVMIDWMAAGTKQEPRLQMFWRESGPTARPEAAEVTGFGTALIRVSGNPQGEDASDGVTCLLEFPVLRTEGEKV